MVLKNCFGGASFADDCASLMSSILGQSSFESTPGLMGATIKAFARGVFEEVILCTGLTAQRVNMSTQTF